MPPPTIGGEAGDGTATPALPQSLQFKNPGISFSPAPQRSQGESSLFTRELWLSASHILREFAPVQQLATRKEDEEANDDESMDDEDAGGSHAFEGERSKLLLVMVGLPARGKSFLAHRLTNYLSWYGLRTRVFNVGAYRRAVGGKEDAEFFDAANKDASATREHLAWTVFSELLQWLTSGKGDVGIFDATNTTGSALRPGHVRVMRPAFLFAVCSRPRAHRHPANLAPYPPASSLSVPCQSFWHLRPPQGPCIDCSLRVGLACLLLSHTQTRPPFPPPSSLCHSLSFSLARA